MRVFKKKAQSTLEYAVIIAVVMAGLIAMQAYIKRGVEGKLRESTDQIGEQYAAGLVESNYTTQQVGDMVTDETFGIIDQGVSRYNVTTPATISRRADGTDAEKINTILANETLF